LTNKLGKRAAKLVALLFEDCSKPPKAYGIMAAFYYTINKKFSRQPSALIPFPFV